MPTNILRKVNKPKTRSLAKSGSVRRHAILRAGRFSVQIALHETMTADLIWRALPLFSVVETWGGSLHFDTPVRGGRDRTARLNAQPGDVCFWSEDERIMIVWGATPISRANEIRLMRPCNIWGHAIEDASVLSPVTAGEKVALERLG